MTDKLVENWENVCPYLGVSWDQTTRYGFPDPANSCYKLARKQPVALSHQEQVCLNSQYCGCDVFINESWEGPLPEGILRKTQMSKMLKRRMIFASAIIILVASAVIAYFWLSGNITQEQQSASRNGSLEAQRAAGSQAVTVWLTLTPPPGTAASAAAAATAASAISREAGSTAATPDKTGTSLIPVIGKSTLSATITGTPTPSPGPLSGTPFGPADRFIVHEVRTGEAIEHLISLYDVSREVILLTNFGEDKGILWVGSTVVIDQGVTDLEEIIQLKAIYVEEDIKVADFLQEYLVTEIFLREKNEVWGDWIRGGRWVIVPEHE